MRTKIKQILKVHDFIYEKPPLEWESCIPLANGFIGAAIWGDGFPLKVSLDKYDIWERRGPEIDERIFKYDYLRKLRKQGKEQELQSILDDIKKNIVKETKKGIPHPTRLPLGTIEILFKKNTDKLQGRLHLADAVFYGNTINAFVCAHKNVIIIRFSGRNTVRSIRLKAFTSKEAYNHPDSGWNKPSRILKSWGYPFPEEGRLRNISFLKQRYSGSEEYTIAWCSAKDILYVTIVTSTEGYGDTLTRAKAVLEETLQEGYAKLLKNHTVYWKEFWNKSMISIPDSRLENLYYAEIYKLGCSSRQRSLPITLQGLWTTPYGMPPWAGDYHLDMNIQESYWPIYASNHLECGEVLYETFFKNIDFCKRLGKKFYGKDIALIMCAVGPGCEPVSLYYYLPVIVAPGNGAWLSHLFWLNWLYSQDKNFLRERAFPFMCECMNVYLHIMEKSRDGKYHLPFSNTPEYFEGAACAWTDDNTYDIDLVKFLITALLESEKILKVKHPFHKTWLDVKKNLVPYPWDDKEGLMLAKGIHLKFSHRHHSHLMGIYPLGHLNPDNSKQARRLIDKSIMHLFRLGTGYWTGWSWPWASLIAGRVGYPELANQYLQNYINAFITENTFHVNGDYKHKGFSQFDYKPMTLEAGFAAAAAILELLIQSNRGIIKLFPGACYWPDGYFANLRAEGAFLVSALKEKGRVKWVKIYSEKGGLCRIEDPFDSKKKVIEIKTQPGGTYTLGKVSEVKIIEKFDRRTNWFGVKETPWF